jgi:hypothetical protein
MITHNFEIDVVAEAIPTNATPNSPPSGDLAFAFSLLKENLVTEAGGLLSISRDIYEPRQIRVVNNTDGTIWWTVLSEDEYTKYLSKYPGLFYFFELDTGKERINTGSIGLTYLLIYLGTATAGIINVEGYDYGILRKAPP